MKKNLELRKVGINDFEQYNELLKYVFQVTYNKLNLIGWQEKEMKKAKQPTLEKADVIGWFDDGQLVSQVAVYPMHVRIFGHTYFMGGLTGVGTYPEYSNRGLMSKLLKRALEDMRSRGQHISYLFPYSIPFYRKKGWEIISDRIEYEIQDFQLPKYQEVDGEIQRVQINDKKLREAYQRYAMRTHGALLRDDLAWNEYFLWDSDDLMAAIYYNANGDADGYIIYWISDDIFHIKDMIHLTREARIGLWNFISAHFSMIKSVEGYTYTDEPLAFLLEDANIKETICPYYMARIVDAERFIAEYPFKPDTENRVWEFNLSDPLLSWNQGSFRLEIGKDGKGRLERIRQASSDRIDIQTLVTMLLGYKRPKYLNKIGRLEVNEDILNMLEDSISQQVPYFSDYF